MKQDRVVTPACPICDHLKIRKEGTPPALLAGVPAECHAQLYRQLIARIVVGAARNDSR